MSGPKRIPGQFVKAWDTDVPVTRSKAALEDMLRRYGATGFTVAEDYASRTVVVAFFLRPRPAEDPIEIRFPIGYDATLAKLRKMDAFTRRADANAQAERVAWRHLVLWVDAALSAVDSGLYSLQEAFFAHAMIDTPGGRRIRAADAVGNVKRLLSGGTHGS